MFRVFQSVRGLADDSVTRLDKNEDLALEMRNTYIRLDARVLVGKDLST